MHAKISEKQAYSLTFQIKHVNKIESKNQGNMAETTNQPKSRQQHTYIRNHIPIILKK